MANINKRKLEAADESPTKRSRKDDDAGIDAMAIEEYAPLVTPLSNIAGRAATAPYHSSSSKLELGRNSGIPNFSISKFLSVWVAGLKPAIRDRFRQRMEKFELIEQRVITTAVLREFMQYVTHELTPLLWEIELCYGLDTNDWLKTNKAYADREKHSSLLARIYNRYMKSVNDKIGMHILNDYREWYALADILEQGKKLQADFSIHTYSKAMMSRNKLALELFPFRSNVSGFVSKLFVLPQCRWPVIITPQYAGFIVHQKRDGQNMALLYAFALPYAITCLPEYIDFKPSVMRQGKVRFHLAFDEPVPWRDGEALQENAIEYVDLELDLLAMEALVLTRISTDSMQLIVTQKRDDSFGGDGGASQSRSASASSNSGIAEESLFVSIPYEKKDKYMKMQPVTVQRQLREQTLFHGVYTTEQDARLTYNGTEIIFDVDINRLNGNFRPQLKTTWTKLLELALQTPPNAFLQKFDILDYFKMQDEASLLTSNVERCHRIAEYIVGNVKRNRCVLVNVEVVADRGEVYVAILQYHYRDESVEYQVGGSTEAYFTIALAFTEDRSVDSDLDKTKRPASAWKTAILFVAKKERRQTLQQAMYVNNCILGYCHEGITRDNKQQVHIIQLAWSFIHQACGIKDNEFPEIDERTLGYLDYGRVLTLPIDDSRGSLARDYHHYTCNVVQWQMSRGMVIVYSNHHSAGNNQLDQYFWNNATLAHYDGANWMMNYKNQEEIRQYVVTLPGAHIRAYDSVVYDKGIFYRTSAHILDGSERSFSQLFFDDNSISNDEERKRLQYFDVGVIHYTEEPDFTPTPSADNQDVEITDV